MHLSLSQQMKSLNRLHLASAAATTATTPSIMVRTPVVTERSDGIPITLSATPIQAAARIREQYLLYMLNQYPPIDNCDIDFFDCCSFSVAACIKILKC